MPAAPVQRALGVPGSCVEACHNRHEHFRHTPQLARPRCDYAERVSLEPTSAIFELLAARALWLMREDAAPLAISGATNALVEGHDSETLRELAGASVKINVFHLGTLIEGALGELGLATANITKDDAQLLAAHYYAHRVIEGTLQIRELAAWAHTLIRHEGHPLAQDLVELDDAYDADEWGWSEGPEPIRALVDFLDASTDEVRKLFETAKDH